MSEKIEKIKIDKTTWGPGPWQNEPDRLDFIHFGFSCMILRHPSLGHFCGYVGVPINHSQYLKDYNDVNVNVHGGLTYANKCFGYICHIPEPGMPEDVWWLGFDCAHSGDFSPGGHRSPIVNYEIYKNIDYVLEETKQLAEQLAKL